MKYKIIPNAKVLMSTEEPKQLCIDTGSGLVPVYAEGGMGYKEQRYLELLPPTTCTTVLQEDEDGLALYVCEIPLPEPIRLDRPLPDNCSVTVLFDGVKYSCRATATEEAIVLGNLGFMIPDPNLDTGEPFVLGLVQEGTDIAFVILACKSEGTYNVSATADIAVAQPISKEYLSEALPCIDLGELEMSHIYSGILLPTSVVRQIPRDAPYICVTYTSTQDHFVHSALLSRTKVDGYEGCAVTYKSCLSTDDAYVERHFTNLTIAVHGLTLKVNYEEHTADLSRDGNSITYRPGVIHFDLDEHLVRRLTEQPGVLLELHLGNDEAEKLYGATINGISVNFQYYDPYLNHRVSGVAGISDWYDASTGTHRECYVVELLGNKFTFVPGNPYSTVSTAYAFSGELTQ